MGGKIRVRRIKNRYEPIGQRGRKIYRRTGGANFFKSLVANAKKLGTHVLGQAKKYAPQVLAHAKAIAPHVVKAVGPALLTTGASKLGEYAARKGAPDSLVNLGSKAAQLAAKKIESAEAPKLTKNQQMVSDFIAGKTQNLLSSMLTEGKSLNGEGMDGGAAGESNCRMLMREGGYPTNTMRNNVRQPMSNYAGGMRQPRKGGLVNIPEAPRVGGPRYNQ